MYLRAQADILEVTGSKLFDIPEKSEVVQVLTKMLKKKPTGSPHYAEAVNYTAVVFPQ